MTTSGMTTRVPLQKERSQSLQASFFKVEVNVGYLGLKGRLCLHHKTFLDLPSLVEDGEYPLTSVVGVW